MPETLDIDTFSNRFDADVQSWLKEASKQISQYRRSPLLMGQRLAEGYDRLKRSDYKEWVKHVLVLDYSTANNYRKAWTAFGEDEDLWPYINLSAMYVLAGSKEAHAIACDKARGMARLGELVDKSVALDLVSETKAETEPEVEKPQFRVTEKTPPEIDRVDSTAIAQQTKSLRQVLQYPQHIIQNAIDQGIPAKDLLYELEGMQEELRRAIQSIKTTLATTNAGDKKDKVEVSIDVTI